MPERGRETAVLAEHDVASRTCSYVPRDSDRKVRREIANGNERRRMQSINAGFQSLRKMLQPRDGDKLSKASVLQKAVDYIYALERDRNCLMACNARLTCHLRALGRDICDIDLLVDDDFCSSTASGPADFSAKRRKIEIESSDEGIGGMLSPAHCGADAGSELMLTDVKLVDGLRRQVNELQRQLDTERQARSLVDAARFHADQHHGNTHTTVPRRGSLETIVEAIHCIEGSHDNPVSLTVVSGDAVSSTTVAGVTEMCCRAPADSNEELVVAAAQALHYIASGRRSSAVAGGNRVSSPWKRERSVLSGEWHSCR